VQFQVFSKHNFIKKKKDNVTIYPLDNDRFIKSMASSSGVICGAGFETPSEALFLGKKLAVVPMKDQYEQHLNAAILKEMGVTVINKLKSGMDDLGAWISMGDVIKVDYPDHAQEIVDRIIKKHAKL
ncbi:MAG: glycosyl transferase, partial [Chitinophagaceae bacterium]